jgi:hypothetical protein
MITNTLYADVTCPVLNGLEIKTLVVDGKPIVKEKNSWVFYPNHIFSPSHIYPKMTDPITKRIITPSMSINDVSMSETLLAHQSLMSDKFPPYREGKMIIQPDVIKKGFFSKKKYICAYPIWNETRTAGVEVAIGTK